MVVGNKFNSKTVGGTSSTELISLKNKNKYSGMLRVVISRRGESPTLPTTSQITHVRMLELTGTIFS